MTQAPAKQKDKDTTPIMRPTSPTPREALMVAAVRAFVDATEAERKTFYVLLLNLTWLSPDVRRAIMTALDISPAAHKRTLQELERLQLKGAIAQHERQLRESGQQRRGIRTKAIEDVATERGVDADVVKKRLQRDRRRTRKIKQPS